MREIKFRGKTTNGEWVYGDLVQEDNCVSIFKKGAIEVIPKTVGQYISKTDKNGKEIYEGDIVHVNLRYGKADITGTIYFNEGTSCYMIYNNGCSDYLDLYLDHEFEIKGNIHDKVE